MTRQSSTVRTRPRHYNITITVAIAIAIAIAIDPTQAVCRSLSYPCVAIQHMRVRMRLHPMNLCSLPRAAAAP
eukprot:jgi/Psemu1/314611/fgenesh1_kg.1624_\